MKQELVECAGLLFVYTPFLTESHMEGGLQWVEIPNCSNRCPAWSGERMREQEVEDMKSLLDTG